jgi:hypothetical protein
MTLVLSCATAEYIVQVCDRWITRRGRNSPEETDRNKGLFVQGRYVFSYSGPAWVGSTPTDLWLAGLLAVPPQTNEDWISEMTGRLANAIPEGQSFACSGFGWVDAPDGSRECMHVVFTNAMDVDTGRWDKVPSEQMWCQHRIRQADQPVLFGIPTGAHINWHQFRATKKLIKRAVAENRGPAEIAHYLVQQIRQTAVTESTVGPDVLVMILPKPNQAEFRDLYIPMKGMPPRYDRPVCYVVGASDRLIDWSGPIFLYDGWIIHPVQKDPASGNYALTAKIVARGNGLAGMFMQENGRRINLLWRPDVNEPTRSGESGVESGHIIGLCCRAQEAVKLVPLPEIRTLVRLPEPYLLQWQCHCQLTSTVSSEEVGKWFGWGASLTRLAKLYRCSMCGALGAKSLLAYQSPA